LLEKAGLRKADFSGGNLYQAKMEYANLRGASFTGADLSNVRLRGASLKDAKLRDARFSIQNRRYSLLNHLTENSLYGTFY
jgi:uncharacterized protein YjbI with pentapeptide repeats